MQNKKTQKALRGFGLYWGKIDNKLRPKSIEAIKAFQKLNSLTPDGILGPKTKAKLFTEEFGNRESDNKTGKFPNQKDVPKFYGKVGSNLTKITLPYKMKIAWDTSKTIRKFSCHKKVAEPLQAIFEETLDNYGLSEISRLNLDMFGGCFNIRKMRGGSRYSMHSWGIAVDIDPVNNQFRWDDQRAALAKLEYCDFWKIVEKHGAISLGRERNFDWMHFQFAQL